MPPDSARSRPHVQGERASLETVLLHAEAAVFAAYAMIMQGMDSQGRALARSEIELLERTSGESDFLPDKPVEVILLWLAGEQLRAEGIISEMHDAGYRSNRLDRWQVRLKL